MFSHLLVTSNSLALAHAFEVIVDVPSFVFLKTAIIVPQKPDK
jgi:hypothetical protein